MKKLATWCRGRHFPLPRFSRAHSLIHLMISVAVDCKLKSISVSSGRWRLLSNISIRILRDSSRFFKILRDSSEIFCSTSLRFRLVEFDWAINWWLVMGIWNCSEIARKLLCHCSGIALGDVVKLFLKPFRNCPENALKVLWNCSGIALELLRNCPNVARKRLGNCSEIALKLLGNCSETARKLLWNCSETAPILLGNRSETARKLLWSSIWRDCYGILIDSPSALQSIPNATHFHPPLLTSPLYPICPPRVAPLHLLRWKWILNRLEPDLKLTSSAWK